MRRLLLQFSIGAIMGLSLLLAGGAAVNTADAESDVAAINKIWELYTKGVNTGDVDLWISVWDDKGIQMLPDAPAVVGKAQIRARVEKIFPQFSTRVAITNKETWVFGNLAFARGTFTRTRTSKAGGGTAFFEGKYLTILKRQADGSWKIFRDCFNSNVPPK